jgi:hypothetical protein
LFRDRRVVSLLGDRLALAAWIRNQDPWLLLYDDIRFICSGTYRSTCNTTDGSPNRATHDSAGDRAAGRTGYGRTVSISKGRRCYECQNGGSGKVARPQHSRPSQ